GGYSIRDEDDFDDLNGFAELDVIRKNADGSSEVQGWTGSRWSKDLFITRYTPAADGTLQVESREPRSGALLSRSVWRRITKEQYSTLAKQITSARRHRIVQNSSGGVSFGNIL